VWVTGFDTMTCMTNCAVGACHARGCKLPVNAKLYTADVLQPAVPSTYTVP
jgi:hypothetical protein